MEDRITLIFNDALDVEVDGTFDLIFLDAAKGQNIRFFEKFEKDLTEHGTIITDNMDLFFNFLDLTIYIIIHDFS